MNQLDRVRLRGAGLRAGPRRAGGRWLTLALVAAFLPGCATKRDLRDLQTEVRALAAQQRETMEALTGMRTAVQDTLRGQSDALFESRGDIIRLLRQIEQELVTLQELTGQNQRALATLRQLIESQGTGGVNPIRTDTEPGQLMDLDVRTNQPTAGGSTETFNVALTQFNRGSLSTARMAFQQFLRDYPNDPLAPDAHYYLADILVQENRLEEAIQAFLQVPEFYPSARKVPEALYRVGVIYIDLDQLDNARTYLRQVVNSYPESGAALLAQERLREIG